MSGVLREMDCKEEIVPVSGYRSLPEQEKIYLESLRNNGAEFTQKYVALPGHSEHQTGFAIDLGVKKDNMDFICPAFPYEGICNEFRKVAPEYGFIQRYQKGKERITGISHEPWHFRYVGYPHSKIISEESMSLEEYIYAVKNYTYGRKSLKVRSGNQCIEIAYVPLLQKENMDISLPDDGYYQISGNNEDGFIITRWREVI